MRVLGKFLYVADGVEKVLVWWFSGVGLLNCGIFVAFRIGHPILGILIFGGVGGGLSMT